MIHSLTAAAVAFTAVCAAAGAEAAMTPQPSVGVFLDFDAPPAPVAVDAMKREVKSIMRSTGVGVNWRLLKENRGNEAFAGLVVVRFKGKCQAQPWTSDQDEPQRSTLTLGTTAVSSGGVLPFSEVECEQVRKSLPYADWSTCDQERQSALGRALGRVVAHELYHALARTTEHAAAGLAKASQSLRDLVTGSLRFGQGDGAAIRRGLGQPHGALSFK